jgi:hypothetical protein
MKKSTEGFIRIARKVFAPSTPSSQSKCSRGQGYETVSHSTSGAAPASLQ